MKPDTIRIIVLILMVILAIGILFVYKEVKEYNKFIKETNGNPCAFCQEINQDVICQKIDTTNKEDNPCQQCLNMGYGVLGYEGSN